MAIPFDIIGRALTPQPAMMRRWTPTPADIGEDYTRLLMQPPQAPAMLPEQIAPPPGPFGMSGGATDNVASSVLGMLQGLGPIDPRSSGFSQFLQAFARAGLGTAAGGRVREMQKREEMAGENKRENRRRQADYEDQRRSWGQQGFRLRRDAQARRDQEQRDAIRQQYEMEQIRERDRLRPDATPPLSPRDIYNRRKAEMQAEADFAKENPGAPRKGGSAKYVGPVPSGFYSEVKSSRSAIGREFDKKRRTTMEKDLVDKIERQLRSAWEGRPSPDDPNYKRYEREFEAMANIVGYGDAAKLRPVLGIK